MELKHKKNARLILLGLFGTLFCCLSLLIHFLNPVKMLVDKIVTISNGSIMFDLWKQPPFEVIVKVYPFNLTNAEDFYSGKDDKLRVEEVGPFVYQELIEHTECKFNDNGTLTFVPIRKTIFRPDLSIGSPEDFVLTVPNVPLLGIFAMLYNTNRFFHMTLSQITNMMSPDIILNVTAHEYLWGYEDKLIQTASALLPNWIDFTQFGILDRMFDDRRNVVTMIVDAKKSSSANPLLTEQERLRQYSIQRWNGSPGLQKWGYKNADYDDMPETNTRCNLLEGSYDGYLYPPNINKNSTFKIYRKAFCRTVPVYVSEEGKQFGLPSSTLRIKSDVFDTKEENPENECYCRNKRKCYPKGFGDLSPCYYGIPVSVTRPHFLGVEPETYTNKILGIAPEPEKHDSVIKVHTESGIPLIGASRMQINLETSESSNYLVKPFNSMHIPVVWTELVVAGPPNWLIWGIWLLYEILPIIEIVFMIGLGLGGLAMFLVSVVMLFYIPLWSSRASEFFTEVEYSNIRVAPLMRQSSKLLRDIRIS